MELGEPRNAARNGHYFLKSLKPSWEGAGRDETLTWQTHRHGGDYSFINPTAHPAGESRAHVELIGHISPEDCNLKQFNYKKKKKQTLKREEMVEREKILYMVSSIKRQ